MVLIYQFKSCKVYTNSCQEWTEVARWIKYEEAVEKGGDRWSKPHVSTPRLKGWIQLRHSLHHGLITMDLEPKSNDFTAICEKVGELLIEWGHSGVENASKLKALWCCKHRHQFEGPVKNKDNLTVVFKEYLVQKLSEKKVELLVYSRVSQKNTKSKNPSPFHAQAINVQHGQRRNSSVPNLSVQNNCMGATGQDVPDDLENQAGKINIALQRKVPANAEAFIILEGAVDFIDKPICVFARLKNSIALKDLPEIDIPTRFLFFYVTPTSTLHSSSELTDIGVSVGTAFTDKQFVTEVLPFCGI